MSQSQSQSQHQSQSQPQPANPDSTVFHVKFIFSNTEVVEHKGTPTANQLQAVLQSSALEGLDETISPFYTVVVQGADQD